MGCKRMLGILSAAVLAVSVLPCSANALAVMPQSDDRDTEFVPFEEESLLGDVNNNGTVEIDDAVLLAKFVTEEPSAVLSDAGLENAEVSGDGLLNLFDVLTILQILAAP